MTEAVTEAPFKNPSLAELMKDGNATRIDLAGQMAITDVRVVAHSETTQRLISKTSNLSMEQIFAAIHVRGKAVASLDVTASGATEYSTRSIDVNFAPTPEKSVTENPEIVHIGTFLKRAKVTGSPGTNVVFISAGSSSLTDQEVDGVKSWFGDRGFKIRNTAPVVYKTTSLKVGYRSLALVFDPEQV